MARWVSLIQSDKNDIDKNAGFVWLRETLSLDTLRY
jgi:hypothetical protein